MMKEEAVMMPAVGELSSTGGVRKSAMARRDVFGAAVPSPKSASPVAVATTSVMVGSGAGSSSETQIEDKAAICIEERREATFSRYNTDRLPKESSSTIAEKGIETS